MDKSPDFDRENPTEGLREALESAYEKSVAEEAAPAPAAKAEPSEPSEREEADVPVPGQPRAPDGKFAKKQQAEAKGHGAAPAEAGATPEASGQKAPAPPSGEPASPAAPADRPPQSWKPAARETWASLPAEVKAEVMRREQETQRALQETAQARRFASQFAETVRPFEAMIRAEGSDPATMVGALLQTAAALRTAPLPTKAQIVAQIVQQYGVPVQMLDAALAGAPLPQQAAPPVDPALQELVAWKREVEQARVQLAQREQEQAYSEVATFGEKHEFFQDVRQDMADLLELAHNRGQKLSLDEAYQRACAMHPEIQSVIQQREAHRAAGTASAATQRAKAAASSVRSSPSKAPPGSSGGGLREELEAAWNELSGR